MNQFFSQNYFTNVTLKSLIEDVIGFKPSSVRRCRTLSHKHGAYVQDSAVVNSTHPFHKFFYVQGSYYLRLSLCHHSSAIIFGDSCVANMRHPICSQVSTFIGKRCIEKQILYYKTVSIRYLLILKK